ncbi:DUF3830 family protein [Natronorubrum halophilum]|uniref:DUF3830 family protein n=1 Tax=Natronorubrum halophilum TaxID=1702106 RepID=UPI000EF745A0|nr:DUF3830 family protein [Natronorubrum halophilum]
MTELEFVVAGETYTATVLEDEAPASARALEAMLPLESELMHVRWSGYATWINVDDAELSEVPRENHTVYPSRGDILLYPGYKNEQELLIACGPTCFKSPAGELAGNHVACLDATRDELAALEERTLRDGVQPITVRRR